MKKQHLEKHWLTDTQCKAKHSVPSAFQCKYSLGHQLAFEHISFSFA